MRIEEIAFNVKAINAVARTLLDARFVRVLLLTDGIIRKCWDTAVCSRVINL